MARKRPEPQDGDGPTPVPSGHGKPHPDAFEPASFGQGGGYGVLGASGSLESVFFRTREEAAAFAEKLRAAFTEGMAQGLDPGRSDDLTPFSSVAGPGGRAKAATNRSRYRGKQGPPTPPDQGPPATTSAAPTPSGRGSFADAFEAAFDASLGKAISGTEKIVGAAVATFQKSFAGVKAAIGNPGAVAAGFSNAAATAGLAASIIGAFASAKVRNAVASFASNVVPSAGQAVAGAWRGFAGFAGNAAQRAAHGAYAAFQAGQAGSGAAGIGRAFGAVVGGGAGAAMTAMVGLASTVGAVVAGFAVMVNQMRAFSESVVDGNRGLARWNGAISGAYIGLSVGDFRRNVQLGRATQDSAITAVRAVDQMRDDWMGVNVLRSNVQNRAAGFFGGFAGGVGADLSKFANQINARIEQVDPQGLVAAGTGAGLWEGIKGFGSGVAGSFDFVNDPGTAIVSTIFPLLALYNGITAGQKAAAAGADAKVVKLAAGATDSNFWGAALHDWAKAGPLLRRPAPRP